MISGEWCMFDGLECTTEDLLLYEGTREGGFMHCLALEQWTYGASVVVAGCGMACIESIC
jgi:hypothetical protein